MIQRIQSIYLLVAFTIVISLFFLPLVIKNSKEVQNQVVYKMELTKNKFYDKENTITEESNFLFIPDIINGILVLITLFAYKNRKNQIKLGRVSLIFSCIFIVAFFLQSDFIDKRFSSPVITFYQAGIYFSVIQVILIWLAINAIKKDEELVRSADRLR